MKKNKILLSLVIAFFTLLFGGITTLADEQVYDDIEDGKYEIDIKLLTKGTDEKSAAAGFMNEEATLIIENGELELTFYIPKNPMMSFNKFEIEELVPATEEVDDMFHYSFKLNELKTKLSAIVSYEVPAINLVHEDVGMDIELVGLDKLPKKEVVEPEDPEQPGNENGDDQEEPTEAPEERQVGKLLTEKEADAIYQLNYETNSTATKGNLLNPVKLLEKDGKQYIQIPIKESGANFFRSLEINDKQVIWNSITEGPYTIQFELPGKIEDTLTLDMVIQAGPNAMPHDGIEVWFNTDTIETIKEPEESLKPAPEERVVGTLITESEADAVYELEYETDSTATKGNLLNPVKLLEKDGKQYIQIPINEGGANYFRSLEINGKQVMWNSITEGPYTIQFELPGKIEDTLTLDMVIQAGPNAMPHDGIEVWFNTDTIETIKEPEEEKEPEESPKPAPEEPIKEISEKVNYVVKHATTDATSAADRFFTKPAHLIERDGEKYVQLTITRWDMIDWLRTDQGDVDIIKVNNDNSVVVEFKVTGDLSDAINLKIKVTVPGLYSEEHNARLFLEIDEGGDPVTEPVVPTPTPDPKPTPKPKPKEKSKLVPDKAFEMDYVVKHATEDRTSAADSFFKKPAFLLYGENGEKYIQLTINDWAMIDWLRTEDGGDVVVIQENDDGSALIQFKVDGDLSDEILLSMSVTVPGLYSMEHEARLIFDVESQKEVEVNDFQIIVDEEGSIPVPKSSELDGPGKPEFSKVNNSAENGGVNVKSEKTNNPQTGDTTSILLYTLLLIGSIIPLAVKLRRRFI